MLAAATRSGKRQAAPFAKGPPKSNPKPPGRKSGDDYGTHARRAVPPRVDEELDAPLPERCPHCGGVHIEPEKIEQQFQTEIPTTPIYRQFNVQIGRCCNCHKRVQGRHLLQMSDALGACASQLGPSAHALITLLNKDSGLAHGKIKGLFEKLFNIPLSRGGACQSLLRTAAKCLPQYHRILLGVPKAQWIVADETGWRVGGYSAWLHAFVLPKVTAYLIDPRRGIDASSRVIPLNFAGTLIHDGYASYNGVAARCWRSPAVRRLSFRAASRRFCASRWRFATAAIRGRFFRRRRREGRWSSRFGALTLRRRRRGRWLIMCGLAT